MRKPIIGLAGGIGAGKSTVAGLLAELGAAVIGSDDLAHRQFQSPAVVQTLRSWWGKAVVGPDGTIDRARVAQIIFADRDEKQRLERLIHPLVAAERERLIAAYRHDASIRAVVLDTPLLFESGLDQRCDAVIFVDAAEEVRRRRVVAERGWTAEQWRRRENTQNALDSKRRGADYTVVNNSSSADQLRPVVQALFNELLNRSSAGRSRGTAEPPDQT